MFWNVKTTTRLGTILIIVCFLVTGCFAEKDTDPIRILLVGHSMVYYNDMSSMLSEVLRDIDNSHRYTVDEVTYPSAGIMYHLHPEYSEAIKVIEEGKYDFVIVFPSSIEPLDEPEKYVDNAEKIVEFIRNAHSRPVITEHRAFDPDGTIIKACCYYEEPWSGGSYDEMYKRHHRMATLAAERTGAKIAYVGTAWDIIVRLHKDIELYISDGAHPSIVGSYLIACTYAYCITGKLDGRKIWRPESVSSEEAKAVIDAVLAANN